MESLNVHSVYLCFENVRGSAWVRNWVLERAGKDAQWLFKVLVVWKSQEGKRSASYGEKIFSCTRSVIFKWRKKKSVSRFRDTGEQHLLRNPFRELAQWSEPTAGFYSTAHVGMMLEEPFGLLHNPGMVEIFIYTPIMAISSQSAEHRHETKVIQRQELGV